MPELFVKLTFHVSGELYQKAKQKVRESGYQFKKGYSRSKSSISGKSSSENSGDESKKRMKIHKDERQREVSHIQALLDSVEEQIKIKQIRVEKAKSVKDFKLCDQLTGDVRALLREKRENEKQLAALKKMETKSSWYHKRKLTKGEEIISKPEKVKKGSDLLELFKNAAKDGAKKAGHNDDSASPLSKGDFPQQPSTNTTALNAPEVIDISALHTEETELESASSGGDTLILSPPSSPLLSSQSF